MEMYILDRLIMIMKNMGLEFSGKTMVLAMKATG